MLLVGTLFWGLSFPVTRMLNLHFGEADGAQPLESFAHAGATMTLRFAIAALVLVLWLRQRLSTLTRSELVQGSGLGLFAGLGLLLQIDGLSYVDASTSAFLTQAYCLILPVVEAIRDRRWPPAISTTSCVLVLLGVAILADVDWANFRMGRGEIETLLSSIFFAAQVLWLDRPCFKRNRANHFSVIMFATIALLGLPATWYWSEVPIQLMASYFRPKPFALLALLIVACTLVSFLLMNQWQHHVAASHAGMIYALEPVSASLLALWMPGLFSAWLSIHYPNESLTPRLLIGGALILLANVLMSQRLALEARLTSSSPPASDPDTRAP